MRAPPDQNSVLRLVLVFFRRNYEFLCYGNCENAVAKILFTDTNLKCYEKFSLSQDPNLLPDHGTKFKFEKSTEEEDERRLAKILFEFMKNHKQSKKYNEFVTNEKNRFCMSRS